MTDTGKPSDTAGPPWSVDLLADLHAGVLDDEQAAQLWPRVQDDAEAMAVLEALDATQTDLSALADAPAPPIPADVAARIDAALAAEAPVTAPEPEQPVAPVVDLAAARRRRNRIAAWGTGVLGAAAAAVAVVAVVNNAGGTTDGDAIAGDANPPGQSPPDGSAGEAPAPGEFEVSPDSPGSAFGDIEGVKDYGDLRTRDGLEACLQAHEIPTTGQTAGIRPGTVDGKDAVIAVLTTGKTATYRIVAVEPTCSTATPGELLIDKVFGLNAGG